ncbi:DUF7504 family protein [Halorussus halophilus]|uniref:DUF7504 family protein n=1 Tax=Halorussus halophilus TaxID=2650975 RepID=UPI0013014587|nr:hypothetical protein [Halorussus halophilus]
MERPRARGSDEGEPESDGLTEFFNLLNEFKTNGCNLLLVGDAPRSIFTRASAQLFGDADAMRYRVLAVTDATPQSIADRLPDPNTTPRPLSETTHVLNHTAVPRSVTNADDLSTPDTLADIRETQIADPQLHGLQSALVDALADASDDADVIRPADVRVGVDSLDPLVGHYGIDVVRNCLRTVGRHVHDHDAMAHYALRKPHESDATKALAEEMDAVIELRAVDPDKHDHDAEERWHISSEDLQMQWTPL